MHDMQLNPIFKTGKIQKETFIYTQQTQSADKEIKMTSTLISPSHVFFGEYLILGFLAWVSITNRGC